MSAFVFEFRRAMTASLSLGAIAALLISAGFMAALVLLGGRITAVMGQDVAPPISVIGALWAAAAGVSVNERNRQTLVEDLWWSLEPRPLMQSAAIYVAWALVAAGQGATVALAVAAFAGAQENAVLNYLSGFAWGLPMGFALAALARRVNGATFIAGVVMISALFFLQPAAAHVAQRGLGLAPYIGPIYIIACISMWLFAGSRTPR